MLDSRSWPWWEPPSSCIACIATYLDMTSLLSAFSFSLSLSLIRRDRSASSQEGSAGKQEKQARPPLAAWAIHVPAPQQGHNDICRQGSERGSEAEHYEMAASCALRESLLQQDCRQTKCRRRLMNHDGDKDDES